MHSKKRFFLFVIFVCVITAILLVNIILNMYRTIIKVDVKNDTVEVCEMGICKRVQ